MKPYDILHEDEDILIANKLSPMPVLKDKSGDEDLQSVLRREHPSCAGFLEAANRIDRRTSGIVVFAKNPVALAALDESFRSRTVKKTYIACLEKEPVPSDGVLKHLIISDPKRNISIAFPPETPPKTAKNAAGSEKPVLAELSYTLMMKTDRYFFVEANPLTGRHHQIRAQFAAMGWPIKGDLKYGARRSTNSGRIMLHGWKIELPHPITGEILPITADLPTDETLWSVLGDFMARGTA